MTEYEYKAVTLPMEIAGLLGSREIPDLEDALNHYGARGWRLHKIVFPPAPSGEAHQVIVVFEWEAGGKEGG